MRIMMKKVWNRKIEKGIRDEEPLSIKLDTENVEKEMVKEEIAEGIQDKNYLFYEHYSDEERINKLDIVEHKI